MLWINRLIAAGLLATAIPLWALAGEFPDTAADFPHVVLAAIAILAVVMMVRSFIPAIAPGPEGEGDANPAAMIKPISTGILAVLAVAAMEWVGFFPAFAGLGLVLVLVLKPRDRMRYLVGLVILLGLIYLVFQFTLDVPLTKARLLD